MTYEVKFDFFIGSKEIPIKITKGQTLIFLITWNTKSIYKFTAETSGIYKIVADADRLKGSFKLTWKLED
jgi:hypothetical protein